MTDRAEFERTAALAAQQRQAEWEAQTGNPNFQAIAAWLTIAEAHAEFDIPLSTLRYHAAQGSFQAMKKGKTWLINTKSLTEWISARSE